MSRMASMMPGRESSFSENFSQWEERFVLFYFIRFIFKKTYFKKESNNYN